MNRICIILCCTFLFSNCKKDSFDYRNQFVGYYNIIAHSYQEYNPSIDTTYSFKGQIILGSGNNNVKIEDKNLSYVEFFLFEDGSFCKRDDIHGEGTFTSSDKVEYKYSLYSQGASTMITTVFIGEKIK